MENVPSFQQQLKRMPARIAHFRIARGMRKARNKPLVLIVEDQQFSRELLHELLRQTYDVILAKSAKEGMHLYLEHAPDIAFLDIELLDESGHALARVIKELDEQTYIVMVTANNSAEDVAQAKANNVNGFVVKPYNKGKIFDSLSKYEPMHSSPPN